jgi:hypothetical protein
MKRSTVLSLPPQLVFPAQTEMFTSITHEGLKTHLLIKIIANHGGGSK